MARSRKPKTPSFEVPADVTQASQSGWVFRSDAGKDEKSGKDGKEKTRGTRRSAPAPAAAPIPPVALPVSADVRPTPSYTSPANPVAATTAVATTAAKRPYGDGPLRFAWMPFAIVCSTVLSLFPSHDHKSGRS